MVKVFHKVLCLLCYFGWLFYVFFSIFFFGDNKIFSDDKIFLGKLAETEAFHDTPLMASCTISTIMIASFHTFYNELRVDIFPERIKKTVHLLSCPFLFSISSIIHLPKVNFQVYFCVFKKFLEQIIFLNNFFLFFYIVLICWYQK
jgi:hypothetical protein